MRPARTQEAVTEGRVSAMAMWARDRGPGGWELTGLLRIKAAHTY